MDPQEYFESICQAMNEPSFYPHPVSGLRRVETHISVVFLTGEWVYKLKKPVDLGFLDFRKLEDRRRFCELEISLNRRLSQGVYLEVVTIHENDGRGFSLKNKGPVAEYAVKMRQLPEERSLAELLRNKKVRKNDIRKLARTLAAFYEESGRSPQIDQYGRQEIISTNMEENFQQLEPFRDEVLTSDDWDFICEVSRSFLKKHQDLFNHRLAAGKIRDGHGDLRAEHIYLFEGIQIIDCVEFIDRFRYGDVVLDLAFLHMDLEHLGYSEWSRTFLSEYVAISHDLKLYALLDFYAAYRATVRLKVTCFRLDGVKGEERRAILKEAKSFFHLTYRYALQFTRPTLWVFCGLPATGKSALAREVAGALSIPILQSDRIRKAGHPSAPEEVVPYGRGSYSLGMRQIIYERMFGQAYETLGSGQSVILDATFSRRKWRDEARRLARDLNANLIFVETDCQEETIRSRLKAREKKTGFSDVRLENYQQIVENFEPLTGFEMDHHISVDTDQLLLDAAAYVLSEGYARICAQVEKIL